MRKKLILSGVSLAVAIGAGAWYVNYRVQQSIANQIVATLGSTVTNSTISKLEQGIQIPGSASSGSKPNTSSLATGNQTQTKNPGTTAGSSQASSTPPSAAPINSVSNPGQSTNSQKPPSSVPVFTSRQQIISYAMSHFTRSEILYYMKMYIHRSSLTAQQKTQIKEQILSHFTPGEIQAMKLAAAKYPQ